MKYFLFLISLLPVYAIAQSEGDFPFGQTTIAELKNTTFAADTSAEAVVLKEFGYAWINSDQRVVVEYHSKIKILKPAGLRKGTFTITLYKSGQDQESWSNVEGVTYNWAQSTIQKASLDPKNIMFEKSSRYHNELKFALPDVRVGSVIEVKYVTESPFIFNFHTWQFQDDIPKMSSEYWCKIPANWIYNITLRGYQQLAKNESKAEQDCFSVEGVSTKAPCLVTKYMMNDIPRFREEKYMTAPSNYISAVYYELSEIQRFEGGVVKYAEEWKDVDSKLKQHELFGQQIKKSRRQWEDQVDLIKKKDTNPLNQAKLIYETVKQWYSWNGDDGIYSDQEIKNAYQEKKGNDADINLALIGALQAADLNADPVLVSTRANGSPNKLHPQRSGFNYVVARLKIDDQQILLDATEDQIPFGVLPMRCLNDQGRIISRDESSWIDLKSTQRQKTSVGLQLTLAPNGEMAGDLMLQYSGYDAMDERKRMYRGEDEYLKDLKKRFTQLEISDFKVTNLDSLSKPLVEKMKVTIEGDGGLQHKVYINPFLIGSYQDNPFKSNDRFYPVDFGAPVESVYYTSITLPEGWKLDEAPANKSFALPNNAARFLMNVTVTEKGVVLACTVSFNKPIYSSTEYHSLKEFFARVVQEHQSQLVIKKIN